MKTYFVISMILLIATLLSALSYRRWWVKGFDAIRLHISIMILLAIVAGFFLLESRQVMVLIFQLLLFFSLLYHFIKIYVFTPLHKVEVPSCKTGECPSLRFLTANVRMSNHQYNKLVLVVRRQKPDVVLLTETDQAWVDGIQALQKDFPYTLLQPQDNTYGMALYSKLPLKNPKINFLIEDDIPSIHVILKTQFGAEIQYIGLHPKPPAPWTKEENKDLEMIVAGSMTNYNLLPSVISGDLNDVGWSRTTKQFKQISDMRDPRVGRGFFNTYNALIPFFRIPIDHFFISRHFKLVRMERLGKFGSDHFPVIVEVGFAGGKSEFT